MIILVDLLIIACGVFLLVYGGILFRFALAVAGFVLGFSVTSWMLASQPMMTRLLISFVVGGALAVVGYMVVKMVLHIAGGILGIVLALIILSLLPVSLPAVISLVAILAGAGVVGFFGNRLGDLVIVFATTLAGAYAVLLGLTQMFPAAVEAGAEYAVSARIPFTAPAIMVFLVVFATGILSQLQFRRVRGRYVNF